MRLKIQITSLFILFILAISFSSYAQVTEEAVKKQSLFDYIYEQEKEPIFQMDTDWKKLVKHKNKEEYQPASVTISNISGDDIVQNLNIRARGNIRKKVCYYPPVKLKYDKDALEGMGYARRNVLKFVIQCRKGDSNLDYVERELFAYELNKIFNPYAMRAKRIQVDIIHNGEPKENLSGFVVEEEDEYAKRVEGKVAENARMSTAALHRPEYVKMCFFQYAIANTDWAVANMHNLEIVQIPGYQRCIPVPYDFDYAGIVNTNYAVPDEKLPITEVTDRHFKGKDVTKAEAREAADFYIEYKDQVMALCDSHQFKSEKTRKTIRKMMEEFYKILENDSHMYDVFTTKY
jgi:hypothetical protein